MSIRTPETQLLEAALESIGWQAQLSRRGFLKGSLGFIAGFSAWAALSRAGQASPLMIMDPAEGLILGDPTKCVGCELGIGLGLGTGYMLERWALPSRIGPHLTAPCNGKWAIRNIMPTKTTANAEY